MEFIGKVELGLDSFANVTSLKSGNNALHVLVKSPSVFKRMWDATKEFPKARQNFIQTLSVKNVKGVIPKASASKTTKKLIKPIFAREKRKRRKVSFFT